MTHDEGYTYSSRATPKNTYFWWVLVGGGWLGVVPNSALYYLYKSPLNLKASKHTVYF